MSNSLWMNYESSLLCVWVLFVCRRSCCLCRALQISPLWGSISRQLTRFGSEHMCDVPIGACRLQLGWRTLQECVLLQTSHLLPSFVGPADDKNIRMITFIRRFYPKRLTVHSGYACFVSVCSLGIEPTTFALLTQCSTTEPQDHDHDKTLVLCMYYGNTIRILKYQWHFQHTVVFNHWHNKISLRCII